MCVCIANYSHSFFSKSSLSLSPPSSSSFAYMMMSKLFASHSLMIKTKIRSAQAGPDRPARSPFLALSLSRLTKKKGEPKKQLKQLDKTDRQTAQSAAGRVTKNFHRLLPSEPRCVCYFYGEEEEEEEPERLFCKSLKKLPALPFSSCFLLLPPPSL